MNVCCIPGFALHTGCAKVNGHTWPFILWNYEACGPERTFCDLHSSLTFYIFEVQFILSILLYYSKVLKRKGKHRIWHCLSYEFIIEMFNIIINSLWVFPLVIHCAVMTWNYFANTFWNMKYIFQSTRIIIYVYIYTWAKSF